MLETGKLFAGSIPENYDPYMAPLIFEAYAADMARRAAALSQRAVLESRPAPGRSPARWRQSVQRAGPFKV
jgi:hypothetical protein